MPKPNHRSGPLLIIATLKLAKAALFLGVAAGTHQLIHQEDAAATLQQWAHQIRIDPHNYYIHSAIEKTTGVSQKQLQAISLGTLLYALLFIIEGVGLIRQKRWAEYLTVITTSLLLPLEIYELIERTTLIRALVLLANLAIVVYLIVQLRRTRHQHAN